MSIEARGVSGQIRKGYRPVARLTSFHLAKDGSVTATVADLDDYTAAAGGPFAVALDVGKKQWVWSVPDVQWHGASVTAKVDGAPQVKG